MLSCEQEFSSPKVAAYLVGHGDWKLSGFYTTINLVAIRARIRKAFLYLKKKVGFFWDICTDVLTVKRHVYSAFEMTVNESEEESVVRKYNQMAINFFKE